MYLVSGTSEETGLLLGVLRKFVLFDVDASMLSAAATAIQHEHSGVEIKVICGDFKEHLAEVTTYERRTFMFLVLTIGNLTPEPRAEFLVTLVTVMQPGGSLLLGTVPGPGRCSAGTCLRRRCRGDCPV